MGQIVTEINERERKREGERGREREREGGYIVCVCEWVSLRSCAGVSVGA